jgi:hypothetical protein
MLRLLLDNVTFVFRDPDDNVVSSFCYITVHSSFDRKPPIVVKPGESASDRIYLSVACDHGFQPLKPGLYSLQAVFHHGSDFRIDAPTKVHGGYPYEAMLAKSNRLPVRVDFADSADR